MKKIVIEEEKLRSIIKKHLIQEMDMDSSEKKPRCLTNNTIGLNDIIGPSDQFKIYTNQINKRDGGISGMIDTLEMLKTLRLLNGIIKDGGEHLSFSLLNHLNNFRNKHYFDETNSDCIRAMDKVIELYKENEHGEELVKDIEKVLSHKEPSARAKEYLKRCINLIKEK